MLAQTTVHRSATILRALFIFCALLVIAAIGYTGWVIFRYWTDVTV